VNRDRKVYKATKASQVQRDRPARLALRGHKACKASRVRPVPLVPQVLPDRREFKVSKGKQDLPALQARRGRRALKEIQDQSVPREILATRAPKAFKESLVHRGFRAFKDRRVHKESQDLPELMAMASLTSAK
jgi:hypothetical protein